MHAKKNWVTCALWSNDARHEPHLLQSLLLRNAYILNSERDRSESKMADARLPVLGITMGDAAGIGPEITMKVLSSKDVYSVCRPLVIGDASTLERIQAVARTSLSLHRIQSVREASFTLGIADVIDLQNINLSELKMGGPQVMTGEACYQYIDKAVHLALNHEIDAMVTAPISKEALNMAGHHFQGHTDLIAEMTKSPDFGMMYVTPTLTVVLTTIHVALSEVPRMITKKRVLTMIKLTDQTMRRLGVKNPRIAVAGLNPHAGEAGMFGREEIEEITPAVEEARKEGLNVTDPLPADTVFLRAHRGQFDAVVSMYHDQGSIPVKLLGFELGVNMTIGLPIIRTSVDHGTAYGHARRGQGDSDPGSLLEAIKLAARLAAPV